MTTRNMPTLVRFAVFLGEKMCLALPAIHGLTGCDTTSFLFKVGKGKVMKKLFNSPNSVQLLDGRKDEVMTDEAENMGWSLSEQSFTR